MFEARQKVHDTGPQKSYTLQEMVVVPANPYLLKEAFSSPSHQPNNATPAFLAISLAGSSSEQTLAACFSVLNLKRETKPWTAVGSLAVTPHNAQRLIHKYTDCILQPHHCSKSHLQVQLRVVLQGSFAKVAAPQNSACA